jgi:hypothetical protein
MAFFNRLVSGAPKPAVCLQECVLENLDFNLLSSTVHITFVRCTIETGVVLGDHVRVIRLEGGCGKIDLLSTSIIELRIKLLEGEELPLLPPTLETLEVAFVSSIDNSQILKLPNLKHLILRGECPQKLQEALAKLNLRSLWLKSDGHFLLRSFGNNPAPKYIRLGKAPPSELIRTLRFNPYLRTIAYPYLRRVEFNSKNSVECILGLIIMSSPLNGDLVRHMAKMLYFTN